MSVSGSEAEKTAAEKSSGQNTIKSDTAASEGDSSTSKLADRRREMGGPAGPDPTRYGDWERKGRCIDF